MVDARDPLRYRSEDLEAYGRELNAGKASLLLLNKADLLPLPLRAAWADHFQAAGVDYLFWSAKAAAAEGAPCRLSPEQALLTRGCSPCHVCLLRCCHLHSSKPSAAVELGVRPGCKCCDGSRIPCTS